MRSVIILSALLLITGCAHWSSDAPAEDALAGPDYAKVTVSGKIATSAERAECEAVGGEIRQTGLAGWEHCIQAYPDAGEKCSDSQDCVGHCLVESEFVDMDTPTDAGRCQAADSPFGCMQMVADGRATPALCVD